MQQEVQQVSQPERDRLKGVSTLQQLKERLVDTSDLKELMGDRYSNVLDYQRVIQMQQDDHSARQEIRAMVDQNQEMFEEKQKWQRMVDAKKMEY